MHPNVLKKQINDFCNKVKLFSFISFYAYIMLVLRQNVTRKCTSAIHIVVILITGGETIWIKFTFLSLLLMGLKVTFNGLQLFHWLNIKITSYMWSNTTVNGSTTSFTPLLNQPLLRSVKAKFRLQVWGSLCRSASLLPVLAHLVSHYHTKNTTILQSWEKLVEELGLQRHGCLNSLL